MHTTLKAELTCLSIRLCIGLTVSERNSMELRDEVERIIFGHRTGFPSISHSISLRTYCV